MSWRIKVININPRTGGVAERTLKLHYASSHAAQTTARQLCTSTPSLESRAVVFASKGGRDK